MLLLLLLLPASTPLLPLPKLPAPLKLAPLPPLSAKLLLLGKLGKLLLLLLLGVMHRASKNSTTAAGCWRLSERSTTASLSGSSRDCRHAQQQP